MNASLNRAADGELVSGLGGPDDAQAAAVAEIVQRVRPDVLLINELDYVEGGRALELLPAQLPLGGPGRRRADRVPAPLHRPVQHRRPVGFRPRQRRLRRGRQRRLRLRRLPGAVRHGGAVARPDPTGAREDVPAIPLEGHARRPPARRSGDPLARRLVLAAGARGRAAVLEEPLGPADPRRRKDRAPAGQPPDAAGFDGAEDRNGLRNADEIRFWADYVRPSRSRYVYDDEGGRGGLAPGAAFVIAGDQNSDPLDGDSVPGAIQQLLEHPLIEDPLPRSAGAVEQSGLQGGANATHRSDAAYDTADFLDTPGPGNLRADYVLPRRSLRVTGSGVFWPLAADPLFRPVGVFPFPSSDHRLVWVDLRVR